MITLSGTLPYLFALITGTCLVTSLSDIRERKIFNHHLVVSLFIGALILCRAAFLLGEDITPHLIGGIAGLAAGSLMYHRSLFRGGDAKLFALLALLMPFTGHEAQFRLPGIELFINSFLIGLAIIIPTILKNLLLKPSLLSQVLSDPKTHQGFARGFGLTLGTSWVLLPITAIIFPQNYKIILLFILYILTGHRYDPMKSIIKNYALINLKNNTAETLIYLIAGILVRLFLAPGTLSPLYLLTYLTTTLSCAGSIFILVAVSKNIESSKDRFPFALLLCAGCLISYTGLLPWVTTLLKR